jgi:ADP-heptose:LPS heptosyltransferase
VQIPLMSLPRVFRTELESMRANRPYLRAEERMIAAWRDELAAESNLKVGLAWGGSRNPSSRHRSNSLDVFAPLASVQGVMFYGLQKGEHAAQALLPPAGMRIVPLPEERSDFGHTAALMMQLDLIISIDTAVAHLAGGLGRPTWVLLPVLSDCRWMLGREDSPWYPTVRLFRQQVFGDWDEPVGALARSLEEMRRMKSQQAADEVHE